MRRNASSKETRDITAAEAAGLVRSGDWIDYGITLCQPDVFDKALAARKAGLRNIKIRSCISMKPRAVLEAVPTANTSFGLAGISRAMIARSMMLELVITFLSILEKSRIITDASMIRLTLP